MRKILMLLAVFCRSMALFPLWLLLLSLYPDAGLLPCCTALAGGAFCCAVWKRFCARRFAAHPKISAGLCISMLTAVCCGMIFLLQQLSCGIAVACLLSGGTLLATQIGAAKEPENLYNETVYALFLAGNVICAGMLFLANIPLPTTAILTVIGVVSAVYLVMRNQFMLLRLVNRRSKTDAGVPREILRGNLMMVLGIVLVIGLLFFFRDPLLHMLYWMQDTAKALIAGIFRAVLRVVEWFVGDDPEIMQPDEIGEMPPPEQSGKASPFWLVLWLPVLMVAYYIWREFLSEWVDALRDWVRMLWKRLSGKQTATPKTQVSDTAEYADTETVVRAPRSRRKIQREWRRKMRAWKRQPDRPEKFYAGYRLMLEAPAWADVKPRSADTVQEIREKWAASHAPAQALDAVTAAYQADRYAEAGLPEKAVSDMTEALERMK